MPDDKNKLGREGRPSVFSRRIITARGLAVMDERGVKIPTGLQKIAEKGKAGKKRKRKRKKREREEKRTV